MKRILSVLTLAVCAIFMVSNASANTAGIIVKELQLDLVQEAEEPAQNNNIKVSGIKRIPETRLNLANGLKTGYYLLKQVNDNASAAGGNGVGWIKADSEAAGQPESADATAEYSDSRKAVRTSTADPNALCVWYVEVVNAENKEIKISTANKIGSWYLPKGSQRYKGLTSYGNATVLKYHIGTATMGSQTATAKEGSCFISNSDVSSFIHFSADELGSWSDANQGSMFMVEFFELSIDDLIQIFTVDVTASYGGTATKSAAEVVEGNNVTLTATANDGYKFIGWYNGETKVSGANPHTFAVTDNIDYEARFEALFPDGAYKIYWEADNRGYLAYHDTDYPNEAKLAGVTYDRCQDLHYAVDQVDLVWYLITASDGKRYLFQAATGKFLGANPSIDESGIANKLSTTEAWPINVEKNTHSSRQGHYIITTVINGTEKLLCSGCGTPKTGHPVRWLTVDDENQKDGGAPLQLIPVDNVTVPENVIDFASYVINGKVQTIPSCDDFLNNFENGKIYYFETSRGVLAAHQEYDKLVSTARQNIVENPGMNNPYCQWTVYKSDDKYYLYNIGKKRFMGTQTENNVAIPFTVEPENDGLVFKATTKTGYPIMFTCNTDRGAVNHSSHRDHQYGLVYWADGWPELNDDGNCHKVTLIGELDGTELQDIADAVARVNAEISYIVEVEDWTQENPNTHFGGITFNCGGVEKKITLTTANFETNKIKADVSGEVSLSHSRKYRGFNFIGFSIDGEDLGKTPNLTDEHKNKLTNGTPLVAKFKTDGTGDVTLFYDDDEFSYRIPAIVKTSTGRLIAVSDYRHNLDDIGRDKHGTGKMRIDLVMRTSDNNGKTWTAKQTIAAGDESEVGSYQRAYGDAAIAAVGENIIVMAAAGDVMYSSASATNTNKMVRVFSSDNGANWSITDMTTKMYSTSTSLFPNHFSAFFGSGKLAVDNNFNGTNNARIYGALLMKNSSSSYNNFVVYSDDLGANWHILGGSQDAIAGGDEPKVEILPSGQILLSARRQGGRIFRVFTYSNKATNEGSWGDAAVNGCNNGGSNGTNGEIICLDAKKPNGKATKILLQSQPKGGNGHYERYNVTIWYKEITDEAQTPSSIANGWTQGREVCPAGIKSAYSAMALQENGEIAFFFEEAPCYADNHEKGYSMVYVPLTIEKITKENFLSPNATATATTVKIELTDTEENKYNDELDILNKNLNIEAIAAKLIEKYPFITLGANGELTVSDNVYTYTNTVTLPFKVSNAENTYWHNIYWPANGTSNGEYYPIYLSSTAQDNSYVVKTTEKVHYGNSQYNTYNYADKLAWAVYNVNEGFTFKFKNKLTDKFMAVNGVVSSGNADNVIYTDEANATAFTLEKYTGGNDSYGNYAIKSIYNGTTGYVCNTSVDHANATNYTGTGHPGAWAKFVESPDYWTIYNQLIADINNFGAGEGKYTANNTISSIDINALATMLYSNLEAKATEVQAVKDSYSEITLTVPVVNDVVPGSVKILEEAVSHKFVPKGEVTIEAVPAAGYYFVNWTKPVAQTSAAARTAEARNEVEVVSTDNRYTFNLTDAVSLEANFEEIVANVTLNDIQGNTYKVTLSGLTGEVNAETLEAKLKAEYPFIEEFGINPTFADNGTSYTYKNSVKLMFKVSKTTDDPKTDNLWHNIYYPSNGSNPNYIAALNKDDVVDMAASGGYAYGANPTYNTMDGNPNISWAIYNVNDSFEFILKSEHTGKYIKANNVSGETTANVSFVDNAGDATAFTLLADTGGHNGDYALVAKIGDATGYLCATSSTTNYVTHFDRTNHQGAWVKIKETDYDGKITALDNRLLYFNTGNDKYMLTSEIQEIIDAMGTYDNPLYRNMTLNTIERHIETVNNKIDSWPKISLTITPENKGTTNIGGEENVVRKYVPTGDLTIEAVPVEGYHFVNWTKGTDELSRNAKHIVTISGVKGDVTELTANFAINVYNITVTAGEGGSATASAETAEYGSEVTLTAVANDGFVFDHWALMDGSSDEGTTVSTSAVYTLTLEANPNMTVTYKAFFRQITALEDGKAYRIAGMMSDGTLRYIYRDGQNLKWSTTKNETTKSIFIAQSDFNGSLNLISAVGDYGWNYGGDLSDSYATLKTDGGSKPGTFTLYAVNGDKKRSYNAYGTSTSNDLNFNTGTDIIKENDNSNCTDMVFEEVPFAFQVSAADGSNAKLGTVNLPFATTLPEGVTAYRVVNDANGYVYVEPLELTDNVLPANTPVLIEAEEKGKYEFKPAQASSNIYETGFAGTLAAETIPGETNAYILSYKGVGTPIKMYKLSSTDRTINANKAYYIEATGKASALQFVFGGTTDIEEVEREVIEDTIYDLQGRKLREITEPGMYIINGKKVYKK